jgi:hypothetical protein
MPLLHTPWSLDFEDIFARTHGYLCILRDRFLTPHRMVSELQQRDDRIMQMAQRNEQDLQSLELRRLTLQRLELSRSGTNGMWNRRARVHPVSTHQTTPWYQNGLHY